MVVRFDLRKGLRGVSVSVSDKVVSDEASSRSFTKFGSL